MLHGFEDKLCEAHCIYALFLPNFVTSLQQQQKQPTTATTVGLQQPPHQRRSSESASNNNRQIIFFRGIARGQIVSPRGTLGWGWDSVFEEERSRLTFAEMEASMKSKFSHRANAITILKKFLAKI